MFTTWTGDPQPDLQPGQGVGKAHVSEHPIRLRGVPLEVLPYCAYCESKQRERWFVLKRWFICLYHSRGVPLEVLPHCAYCERTLVCIKTLVCIQGPRSNTNFCLVALSRSLSLSLPLSPKSDQITAWQRARRSYGCKIVQHSSCVQSQPQRFPATCLTTKRHITLRQRVT